MEELAEARLRLARIHQDVGRAQQAFIQALNAFRTAMSRRDEFNNNHTNHFSSLYLTLFFGHWSMTTDTKKRHLPPTIEAP